MERWATFDCYGTLVDWNAGIHAELEKLFGVELADGLLVRYHELEPKIQAANPGVSYREVLTLALEALAAETGLTLPEGETSALAQSLPTWPVFDDVRPGLTEAHERGWKLGILSNTDRDLIDALDRGARRPVRARRSWPARSARTSRLTSTGRSSTRPPVPIGAATSTSRRASSTTSSLRTELGIPSIWINRLGEPDDPRPTATLTGVGDLADALDALVSA